MGNSESSNGQIQNKNQYKVNEFNEANYEKDVILEANLARTNKEQQFNFSIEISIKCKNLPRIGRFQNIDSYAKLYILKNKFWDEIGQTDIVQQTQDPKYLTTFVLNYNYEKPKPLKIEIYTNKLIGTIECDIQDIVQASHQIIAKPIQNSNSIVSIMGHKFEISSNKYIFRFGAKKFSHRKLYLKLIYRYQNNDLILETTEDQKKNNSSNNYEWKSFFVLSKYFSNEDDLLQIQICQSSSNQILYNYEISLKKLLQKTIISNHLIVFEARKIYRNNFLNYLQSGSKLQMTLAMDFTNSNAQIHNDQQNQYIQAINKIIGTLQYFDSGNKTPFYGFGAQIPPYHDIVSHCFACNGRIFNPEVDGIQGLIKTYHDCLTRIVNHGPGVISEVVNKAIDHSKSDKQIQNYYVLIIITGGKIIDLQKLRSTISKEDQIPLSIMIVGVGNNNFDEIINIVDESNMKKKDQNKHQMFQFIKFNDFINNDKLLQKEVLSAIPDQFLQYMKFMQISPADIQKIDQKTNYFYQNQRQQCIEELKMFQYDEEDIINVIDNNEIFSFDLNLVSLILNSRRNNQNNNKSHLKEFIINPKQQQLKKTFDDYLQKQVEKNPLYFQQQINLDIQKPQNIEEKEIVQKESAWVRHLQKT